MSNSPYIKGLSFIIDAREISAVLIVDGYGNATNNTDDYFHALVYFKGITEPITLRGGNANLFLTRYKDFISNSING